MPTRPKPPHFPQLPTCCTCTVFAHRPSRPKPGSWPQHMAAHHPSVHLEVPPTAALPARRHGAAAANNCQLAGGPHGGGGLIAGRFLCHGAGRTAGLPRRADQPRGATRRATWARTSVPKPSGTPPKKTFTFTRTTWTNCAPCSLARCAHRDNYLALIAKGDEVLDWREMHGRYQRDAHHRAGGRRPCAQRLPRPPPAHHAVSRFGVSFHIVFGQIGNSSMRTRTFWPSAAALALTTALVAGCATPPAPSLYTRLGGKARH